MTYTRGYRCTKLVFLRFVITDHVREVTLECVSDKDKQKLESDKPEDEKNGTGENESEPPEKVQRLSKSEKKKLRGQNKARPAPFRQARESQLCNYLVDIVENEEKKQCPNEKCKFLHDTAEYLKSKPKDISMNVVSN